MSLLQAQDAQYSVTSGFYLYAIIPAERTDSVEGMTGFDGAPVSSVIESNVAAVVSMAPSRKLRPERRRLAVHSKILRNLIDSSPVLPMAFGLVADTEDEVRRLLRLNHDAFEEQFDHVQGRVEMGLRIQWDVPNIFEYLVTLHPDLQKLRDQIFRGGREPLQGEKIELGRQFDQVIEAEREDANDRVQSVLSSHCVEIVQNPPRSESEVLNLACLIDRDQSDPFETAVYEAARLFDDHYAFDFNGPWPPHNFVKLELQTS